MTKNNKLVLIIEIVLLLLVMTLLIIIAIYYNNHKEYTVTFISNNEVYVKLKVKHNTRVEEPKEPVREGYVFGGWYLNDEEFNFNSLINSDVKLVASWEVKEE